MKTSRAAFTLIELAVTTLVISIGVLVVFAAIGIGMKSAKESSDDVKVTEFAAAAFDQLAAISDHLAYNHDIAAQSSRNAADRDEWLEFWTALRDGETNLLEMLAFIDNEDSRIEYACDVLITNTLFLAQPVDGETPHAAENRAQVSLQVWPSKERYSQGKTFFAVFERIKQ